MRETELKEARELLIGTWIGIALLADALIERRVLSKKELMLLLSQTEEASSDKRRTALVGFAAAYKPRFQVYSSLGSCEI